MRVKIASWNVKGLNLEKKRKQILYLLEKQDYDIICIQETKIREDDKKCLENPKLGNLFFSCIHKTKRGVATYINKRHEAKQVYKDTEGRILITEVTVGNEKLMVANIYAPLENKGNFFVIINDILTDYNKGNVIVAGDFNAVVKPSRDRKSVKPIKHNQGKLPISGFEMMKEQELIDVWPKLYQEKSGFTFFSECHKSHSRIDLF